MTPRFVSPVALLFGAVALLVLAAALLLAANRAHRCGTLRRVTVLAHHDGHLVPVCSEVDFRRRVRGLPAEIESPSLNEELYGEA